MSQPAVSTQGTVRFLRTVYGVLLVSMVLDVVVAERFSHQHQSITLGKIFPWYLAVLSMASVSIAVWARITFIRPALERLQLQPDGRKPGAIDPVLRCRHHADADFLATGTLIACDHPFALPDSTSYVIASADCMSARHRPRFNCF